MTHARIVAVVNLKGGVSKSTTVAALAMEYARRGLKVLVLDRDVQLALRRLSDSWQGKTGIPFEVREARSREAYFGHLESAATSFDLILVDCPPNFESDAIADTLQTADLALIPLKPSGPDYATTRETKKLVKRVQEKSRPDLVAALLITIMIKNSLNEGCAQMIRSDELPTIRTSASSGYGWGCVLTLNRSIYDVPNTEKTRLELQSIADEVAKLAGIKATKRKSNK